MHQSRPLQPNSLGFQHFTLPCTGGSLPDLNTKEYTLLSKLKHVEGQITQRELAQQTGISIGLINAVIKRLIRKGYIKVKAFNKKKVNYFLTSKGAAKIIKQSYEGIIHVIQHYQKIESRMGTLIGECVLQGDSTFFLHGDGDLERIVKGIFKRNFKNKTQILKNLNGDKNVTILNLTAGNVHHGDFKVVNVLKYLNSEA